MNEKEEKYIIEDRPNEVFPQAYRVGILFMEGLKPYARNEKINPDERTRNARSQVLLYLKGLEEELKSLDRRLNMKKGLSLYLAKSERYERVMADDVASDEDDNDGSDYDFSYDDAEEVEKSSNGVNIGSVMDQYYSSGSFSDELYDIMKKTEKVVTILEKGELSISDAEKVTYNLGIITQKSVQETLSSLGITIPSDDPKTFSAIKEFGEGVDVEIRDNPYVILRRMLMTLGSSTLELLDQEFEYDVSRGMHTNAPRIFTNTEGLKTRKGFSQYMQNVLSSEYECTSVKDSRMFLYAMSFLYDENGRFREKYSAVNPEYRTACGKYIKEFFGNDLKNIRDYDALMEKEREKGFDFLLSEHINKDRIESKGTSYFRIPGNLTDENVTGLESYCRELYVNAQAGKLSQNVRNEFFKGAEAVMLSRKEKGKDSFQVPSGFADQDFSFSSIVSDILVPNAGRSLIDAVNYYCQLLKMESYIKGLPFDVSLWNADENGFSDKVYRSLDMIKEEKLLIGQDIDGYLNTHSREDIKNEISDALDKCHYPLTKWIDTSMTPNLRKMIFNLVLSIQARNTEDFDFLKNVYLPYCQNNRDTYRKIFFEPFFTVLETADLRTKKGRQDATRMIDELVNKMLDANEYDKGVYIGELYRFPSFRKAMDALVTINEKAEKERLLDIVSKGYDMMMEAYDALRAPIFHNEEENYHLTISDVYNDSTNSVNVSAVYLIKEMIDKALPEEFREKNETNEKADKIFYSHLIGALSRNRYNEAVSNLEQTRNARGQLRASYDSSTISFYFNGEKAEEEKKAETEGSGAIFRITAKNVLGALEESDRRFENIEDVMRLVETGSMSMKDAASYLDSKVTEADMKERELAHKIISYPMDPEVQYHEISRLYSECFVPKDRVGFEKECEILESNNPFLTKERMLKAFDTDNSRAFLSMLFMSPDGMATVMGRKDMSPESFLNLNNPLVKRINDAETEYVKNLKKEAMGAYNENSYRFDSMSEAERESYYARYLATYRAFSPQTLFCLRNFSGMSMEDALNISAKAKDSIEYMSNVVIRDVRLFRELAGTLDAETDFCRQAKEVGDSMGLNEAIQASYPKTAVIRGLSRPLAADDPLAEEIAERVDFSKNIRLARNLTIDSPFEETFGAPVKKGSDLRNTFSVSKGKTLELNSFKADLKNKKGANDTIDEYYKTVQKNIKGVFRPEDRRVQEIATQVVKMKKSLQKNLQKNRQRT